MKFREIGKTGIRASVVGFGTWAIGGDPWWDKETKDEDSIAAIQAGLDHGINLIDTAPGYGRGRSELVVGKAITGYDREKLVISTKCGIIWWGNEGAFMMEVGGTKLYRNLEPHSIRTEVENSLRNMKTDYIDVLHTHWQSLPEFPTPISRTMEGLMQLQQEGKIRAIGVSNCDVAQMKEYMEAGRIDVNQPPYSMLNRGIEGEFTNYCLANDISIFAYSPLEQGLLTGNFKKDYEAQPGTYRADFIPWYKKENRVKVIDMLDGWKDIAQKYNATISQIVIAWTYCQPGITHVLCGARHPGHVIENVNAGNIELSAAELTRMRADIEALGAPV
jgi:methylglyoxal reductase